MSKDFRICQLKRSIEAGDKNMEILLEKQRKEQNELDDLEGRNSGAGPSHGVTIGDFTHANMGNYEGGGGFAHIAAENVTVAPISGGNANAAGGDANAIAGFSGNISYMLPSNDAELEEYLPRGQGDDDASIDDIQIDPLTPEKEDCKCVCGSCCCRKQL